MNNTIEGHISRNYAALCLLLVQLLLSSCNSGVDLINNVESAISPSLTSFSFLRENNPFLDEDIHIQLGEDGVTVVFVPYLRTDSLIATFEGTFDVVKVNGKAVESGKSVLNYNDCICYSLFSKEGTEYKHFFYITGYNGIPRVFINTEDGKDITSKKDYISASIVFLNVPQLEERIDTICMIRGRGNSSWKNTPKLSYKIKFLSKQNPFGFGYNKDWVLLAMWWDKSLLRWPFMFELSKALNMPFTVNYKYVELFLNNDYVGTYLLTDHIERAKQRVDIESDGYLIECDNYYDEEPLWFTTNACNLHYTFKYPKADDGDIKEGDDNYSFIVHYMNNLENSLEEIDTSNEFLNLIDLESFAKWYVHEELLGNYDVNQYYILRNKKSKLEAGPLWDADWSIGAATWHDGFWEKYPYQANPKEIIWDKRLYYNKLLSSSDFRKAVQLEWNRIKPMIPEIRNIIEQERKLIYYTQVDNFEKWDILGELLGCNLVALGSWDKEVDYLLNFFDERVNWFDQYVMGLTNN